jgi:NADPH-dependent glutamate synthase beta subunit-like oxidoreductase
VRSWIGVIAQRKRTGLSDAEAYAQAWGMITEVNPFPGVLGRICPHPCESHCNRTDYDGALSVNAMERFLGDWALDRELPLPRLEEDTKPEWIGVVGAGPSGLSFAYQMARRGYRVTVYEQKEKAGGMLRYGIPDYRLPQEVLDSEIRRIQDLGVELRLGVGVGTDITLEELRERHEILYLGIGAQKGRALGLEGESRDGVWRGTDYLERVNRGEKIDLGRAVVVVGGGNTAIDAARTARRSGAEVTLLYRRSREEMPAIEVEVEEALDEGVNLVLLAAPVRLERSEDGRLTGVAVRRMELGAPDESGRRRPIPIPGSDFPVRADTVLTAIAQVPDWKGLEELANGDSLDIDPFGAVSDWIWAGGDVLTPNIAGVAIGHGRRAAEALHARLRGLPEPGRDDRQAIGPQDVFFGFHPEVPRHERPHLSPEESLARPDAEVVAGLSEEQFLSEAGRCLSCGSCFGCQQCWMYCTSGCFTRVEEPSVGVYFTLSVDQCEECGKCVEVCPCGFLETH